MIKRLKNKKGFTLAELLIVVAIIAVLVAISIPIFTAQLEKARQATDAANIRSAYAEASAKVLDSESNATVDTEEVMQSDKWDSNTYKNTKIGKVAVTSIDKTKGTVESVTVGSDGSVTIAPKSGN